MCFVRFVCDVAGVEGFRSRLGNAFLPRAEGGGGADPAVLRALGRELGEAVCCYFPVSFRPPPGDVRGISRADLAVALTSAMAGEGAWAEVVVPLALEKLEPNSEASAQVRERGQDTD